MPHIHGEMQFNMEKKVFAINIVGTNGYAYRKKLISTLTS